MASSILILTLALTFWPAVVHSEIQEVRLECTPCFYVKHESVLDCIIVEMRRKIWGQEQQCLP